MANAGDVIENPVTGQRLIFEVTSADSSGEAFVAVGIFPPGGLAGVTHIHPHQDEHFEVLAGRAAFEVDGTRHVLGPGGTIEVPKGTKHTFANAGQEEMRVRFSFRPALTGTERFYEVYFASPSRDASTPRPCPACSTSRRYGRSRPNTPCSPRLPRSSNMPCFALWRR
jgi:mannose-6-phosphate isomerase-like protein (cupin superfamily)